MTISIPRIPAPAFLLSCTARIQMGNVWPSFVLIIDAATARISSPLQIRRCWMHARRVRIVNFPLKSKSDFPLYNQSGVTSYCLVELCVDGSWRNWHLLSWGKSLEKKIGFSSDGAFSSVFWEQGWALSRAFSLMRHFYVREKCKSGYSGKKVSEFRCWKVHTTQIGRDCVRQMKPLHYIWALWKNLDIPECPKANSIPK